MDNINDSSKNYEIGKSGEIDQIDETNKTYKIDEMLTKWTTFSTLINLNKMDILLHLKIRMTNCVL